MRRIKNTHFPIFIFVNDVESDIFLQNNQPESNENQNHRETVVEFSPEIDIQKTATHPYNVTAYRAKSLEALKKFINLQIKRKFIDNVYVPQKDYQFPFRTVSGLTRQFNSKW